MINRRTAGWCLLKLITRQRQKKRTEAATQDSHRVRQSKNRHGQYAEGTHRRDRRSVEGACLGRRPGESLAELQFSRVHSGLRLPPPWAAVESGCRKSNGQCVG